MAEKIAARYMGELVTSISDDGRQWVQLLPWGEIIPIDGRGPWYLEAAEAESIRAAWALRNGRPLLFDWEHNSDRFAWETIEKPTRAAGWIRDLRVFGPEDKADGPADGSPAGAWAHTEWTPPGKAAVEGKEYLYTSGVFWVNEDGRVLWISKAGLTNEPAIDTMVPVAARKAEGRNGKGTPGEGDMSWKEHAKTLGIVAETEELFVAELARIKARADATPPPVPVAVAPVVPVVVAAEPGAAELAAVARAEVAEKRLATIAAEMLIDAAIGVGKLSAATRTLDVEDAVTDPERMAARIALLAPNTHSAKVLPPQGRQGASAAEAQARTVEGAPSLVLTGANPRVHSRQDDLEHAHQVLAGLSGKLGTPEATRQIRTARLQHAVGG